MKIVLFQPQIPQNTGNILRTCAVTGASLVLVHPLGFHINDRWLRRAGLDYWDQVSVEEVDNLMDWLETASDPFTFFSSKGSLRYDQVSYSSNSILIFGSETEGIPQEYWERWPETFAKIPMQEGQRCLNLATSAGIGLYEAWRQNDFLPTKKSIIARMAT